MGDAPHLRQGAKMLGKKALQTGVNVAHDVIDGENLNTAVAKRGRQALDLASQNSPQAQSGEGRKPTKRKAQPRNISSPQGKKAKTSPKKKKMED